MNQHERRVAAVRADRDVIERAAARLRSDAIRSGYAGLQHQHVAFGLALVLDELARHVGRPGPGRAVAGRPVVPRAAGRAARLPGHPPHPPPVTVFHVKQRPTFHVKHGT